MTEKLWDTVRLRMTGAMASAIRALAELEDRQIGHETRRVISLGLEVERKRLRKAKMTPNHIAAKKRFFQYFGEGV